MQIIWKKSTIKVLKKMQPGKSHSIRAGISKVATAPFARDITRKPLAGVPDGYRKQFGDWRVSYTLDSDAGVLEVFEIAPRGGAYR